MSKNKILKKAAFGGFKKEDVLDYIESLQQEIVSLKRDASDCAAYKRELEELKARKASNEKTVEELRAENSALKAENSSLIEKNASYSLKFEEINLILEKSREAAAESEKKYEALNDEYSKVTDMNKLVVEARQSVSEIASDAKRKVDSVKSDVAGAADRFRTVCVNFESSAASLRSGTEALIAALSNASSKLDSIDIKEE